MQNCSESQLCPLPLVRCFCYGHINKRVWPDKSSGKVVIKKNPSGAPTPALHQWHIHPDLQQRCGYTAVELVSPSCVSEHVCDLLLPLAFVLPAGQFLQGLWESLHRNLSISASLPHPCRGGVLPFSELLLLLPVQACRHNFALFPSFSTLSATPSSIICV